MLSEQVTMHISVNVCVHGERKNGLKSISLQSCYFFQSQIILCALRQVFAETSMCLYISIYLLNHRTIEQFRLEKTFKIVRTSH